MVDKRIKKVDDARHKVELALKRYHRADFIKDDPISIPHSFEQREDIEIAGFLTATISWGNRKSIIANANRMMDLMDRAPLDFVLNFEEKDAEKLAGFVHRTFNAVDFQYFLIAIKEIFRTRRSLEEFFVNQSMKDGILNLRKDFFKGPHPSRTLKHVSNPAKGSAAKRINMFLKWMIRKDEVGVDFGIWDRVSPKELMIPLDVHVHRVALDLGLMQRKQADWKAVEELTAVLRTWDPDDPVKYDYGLFMMGVDRSF